MRITTIIKNKLISLAAIAGLVLSGASAQAAVFEKNELRIVITPDHFPIIWMNADKYGVNLDYDSSQVIACGSFCSAEAVAEGATTFRTYVVNQYVTVTAYYDAAGNVVGTSSVDNTPPPPPSYESSYYGPFDVGSLQGEFNVSPSGSASYSLGIDTPPGINGMKPQVGVSYDSQAGNGLMGIGWGVTGLSEITRCPKTLVDDGYIHGVDFTSADAFCLDGQRLVNVGGSEYRPKNDNSVRVIYSGNAFYVHSRNGTVTEYGVSSDSNIKAQGKTATRVWAINKVTDVFSNSTSYSYFKDEVNGIYRVTSISYAGGRASVDFEYEDRPDTMNGYQAGSLYKTVKRLKYIKVNHQDYTAPISTYKFFYEFDASSVNPSRLAAIQKCNGSKCLKPVGFTWNAQGQGFNGGELVIDSSIAANQTVYSYYGLVQGLVDVTGDGLADRVWVPNGSNEVWVAKATGNGFQTATRWLPGYAGGVTNVSWKGLRNTLADVDGDGLADWVWMPNLTHEIWVAKSTGSSFAAPQRWIVDKDGGVNNTYSFDNWHESYQDMNGDGRMDKVWMPDGVHDVWVALSTGNDFATPTLWKSTAQAGINLNSWDGKYIQYADVNGDGMTDWVWMPNGRHEWWVALSTGTSFQQPTRWLADFESPVDVFSWQGLNERLVDVNADGLPDRVWMPNGVHEIWVALSTGSRFATPTRWLDAGAGGVNVYSFEGKNEAYYDVNADGYTDKVWIPNGTNDVWVALSDGTRFLTPSRFMTRADANGVYLHSDGGYRNFAGDINGDGSVDRFWLPNGASTYFYAATSKSMTARIEAIEDGMGLVRDIVYKPLTDSSVYTRGSTAQYPEQDIQFPQYVVAEQSTTDGLDGTTTITYRYEGARVHLQGRGQLGFAKTVSTNTQTGLITEVQFYQNYPYVGMVMNETQRLNGNLLSYSANVPSTFGLGNGRELVYVSNSVNESYDINGNHLSTVATISQINGNTQGNITDTIVTTQDANDPTETYVTYTNNVYGHEGSGNFYLESQVTQNSVYKTGPMGTSPTVYQSFVFDPSHYRLKSETGWVDDGGTIHQGLSKVYGYDGFGHIDSTTVSGPDITTRIAETNYDITGLYPEEVINEMGHIARITSFNAALGVPLTKEDANGLITSYQYDEWGRVTDVYAPGGNVTHTTRAWCELNCTLPAVNSNYVAQTAKFIETVHVTGGVNSAEQYMPDAVTYYDKLGREIRKQTSSFDNQTILMDTAYDNLGRVVASTKPYFVGDSKVVSTTQYDALNRPVITYVPDEGTSTVTFNGFRVTTQTSTYNPVTNTTVVQTQSELKNVIGQVMENVDNDGNVLSYEYDAQGNKSKTFMPKLDTAGNVIDPTGTVLEIQYDVFGRKKAMIDPNMGTWSYTYDSTSKLRTQTDAEGQVTVMEYDRAGRMIKRTDDDGTETHWVYGDDLRNGDTPTAINIGKLRNVYMQDSTGFEIYRQDYTYTPNLGLADTTTTTIEEGDALNSQKVSYVTETDYDRFHRPEITTYPQTIDSMRLAVKYQYVNGVMNAVKSVDDLITYWEGDARNAAGSVTAASLRNGDINTLSDFDDAGRLVYLNYNTGSLIYQSTYDYDGLGNLVFRDSQRGDLAPVLSQRYYYDTLNRLTSVTINGVVDAQQYSYDVLGNVRSRPGTSSIDYLNTRPNAINQVDGQTAYTYTNNGGLLNGGGRSVSWTPFNKPASISKGTAQSVFKYGPSRARYYHESTDTADPSKDSLTYYVGGSFEKVAVNGVTKYKHYIRAGGQSVAQYTVFKDAQNQTVEETQYLLRDYQGSTVAVIDAVNTVSQLDYDTFGRRQAILGASVIDSIIDSIPRGYTGHEHLDKLGLIHMNGRVYDSELGRFLSADPLIQFSKNLQSYNRYSYVLNNPMSYTDPSGFSLKKMVKNTRRAIGKAISKTLNAHGITKSRMLRRFFLKYDWARTALQVGAGVVDALISPSGCVGCASIGVSAYLTEISGGSYGDIGKAAMTTAASAYAFKTVGDVFKPPKGYVLNNFGKSMKILAHGAVGGLMARASGGKFADGFLSAAASQAMSLFGGYEAIGIKDEGSVVYNAVASYLVGGTISRATGGDFQTGGLAAMFGRMFNDLPHSSGYRRSFLDIQGKGIGDIDEMLTLLRSLGRDGLAEVYMYDGTYTESLERYEIYRQTEGMLLLDRAGFLTESAMGIATKVISMAITRSPGIASESGFYAISKVNKYLYGDDMIKVKDLTNEKLLNLYVNTAINNRNF